MKKAGTIDYVELPARDIEATKHFFSAAFEWTFVDYGPEYVSFQDAGLSGGFYKSDKVASTASGSALVVLYSDALEHTHEVVLEAGGEIIEPIFEFPGASVFILPIRAGTSGRSGRRGEAACVFVGERG